MEALYVAYQPEPPPTNTARSTKKSDIRGQTLPNSEDMPNPPQYPPMPYTTKKATKRKKYPKRPSIRQPSSIGLIYREGTDAVIADKATEARLSQYGPPTDTRKAGYNFIWGEVDNPSTSI